MNGRTTYADLARDTTHAMAIAHSRLVTTVFPTQAAALRAIEAHRDMATALADLGWRLVHGAQRPSALPGHASLPEELRPAVRVCDVLSGVGKRRPWLEREATSPEPVVEAWTRAAVLARTAQDLLATYWDAGGVQTTPTSQRLERIGERAAAMDQLADQAGLLADAADTLAMKAMAAGVAPEQVVPVHEGGLALRRAVDEHHLAARGPESPPDRLERLEVARPAVRTDDPLVELGDRVARLHRFAWQLTTEPHVGVPTLSNYAAAGCLIAKATGRELQRVSDLPESPVASGWASPHLQELQRVAAGWYNVFRHLGPFRSMTPGAPGVRADVTRIQELIEGMGEHSQSTGTSLPVLLPATRAFNDIARWNRVTLERQADAGDIWLRGQDLPRDVVSEERNLAQARLAGRVVVAPPSIVRDAVTDYARLAGRPHMSPSAATHLSRTQAGPAAESPS